MYKRAYTHYIFIVSPNRIINNNNNEMQDQMIVWEKVYNIMIICGQDIT